MRGTLNGKMYDERHSLGDSRPDCGKGGEQRLNDAKIQKLCSYLIVSVGKAPTGKETVELGEIVSLEEGRTEYKRLTYPCKTGNMEGPALAGEFDV